MRLPRFFSKLIPGFEVTDVKEWRKCNKVEIFFKKATNEKAKCHRCGSELQNSHGKYRMKIKHLPIFNQECFLIFWREKRYCPCCKKVRAEALDFVSKDSPHLSQEYTYWLGRMFEIASVKQVAHISNNAKSTMHNIDFKRLQRMIQHYEIPDVKHICVDEVHARSKKNHKRESRNKLFFTIVTDVESRRVIWVSESRTEKALNEFFTALGEERCKDIMVVATDQHEAYRSSVLKNCPNAEVVWDKFHLIQNFEMVLNDTRDRLHKRAKTAEEKRLTRGKWRFAFLKKASRRTSEEQRHIDEVVKDNTSFFYLELIKERFFQFFYAKDKDEAKSIFEEIGRWIHEAGFEELEAWWYRLAKNWWTLENYFKYRLTTALAEGTNNVIKMLKRRGFGYRNMTYFKLKIMQVCGFLNSRYVPMEF